MTGKGFPVIRRCLALLFLTLAAPLWAADYPAPKSGSWTIKNFRFNTGEVMPELKVNYHTVGEPTGEPVLILHGTGGSGRGLLSPGFAGELFGPGQPLDATRHYIILPDAIGAGGSSKPSDGLRMAFPKYNYEDMVRAQHALVTEHLGIKQLKLVLGNSMGGMHTWLWGVMYPDAMRNLVPMASMPVEVAGRNWMTRRMLMEVIKLDPDWNNGNYTRQPRGLQVAQLYFSVATLGGQPGPAPDRADTREGRPVHHRPAGQGLGERCQRHPLPVRCLARLQPGAPARSHPRPPAGHQCRRRRAQPARTRRHGA